MNATGVDHLPIKHECAHKFVEPPTATQASPGPGAAVTGLLLFLLVVLVVAVVLVGGYFMSGRSQSVRAIVSMCALLASAPLVT